MKRSELVFSAILVPLDFIMVVLAALSAYAVRNIPEIVAYRTTLYNVAFDDYLRVTLMVAPLFLLVYAIEGLYTVRATGRFSREATRVFKATSLVLVIVIIAIFLRREWFASRFIIVAGWGFVVLYVTLARSLLQAVQKWLLVKKRIGVYRVLLVGGNGKAEYLKKTIRHNPSLGYKVVAKLPTPSLSEIKQIHKNKGVDEVIVCDPTITDDEQAKLLDYCQIHNITYKYLPTTLQTSRLSMRLFGGEPMIEIEHTPLDGWGKILKRTMDILVSSVMLVLLSPFLLLFALLIKLEDRKGPAIYKNERIGENGETFFVYKFRYMKWDYCITKENPKWKEALEFERKLIEEKNVRDDVLYKIKDDPRKMVIGAFLERYSLDELPQFWNVLKGNMSLVGPRPHQKREVEKYEEYHRRLLTIKPGITGMAQVAGRSDLSFEDEYRLDVFYIENWSLKLDLILCLKTVGVVLRRRRNL